MCRIILYLSSSWEGEKNFHVCSLRDQDIIQPCKFTYFFFLSVICMTKSKQMIWYIGKYGGFM